MSGTALVNLLFLYVLPLILFSKPAFTSMYLHSQQMIDQLKHNDINISGLQGWQLSPLLPYGMFYTKMHSLQKTSAFLQLFQLILHPGILFSIKTGHVEIYENCEWNHVKHSKIERNRNAGGSTIQFSLKVFFFLHLIISLSYIPALCAHIHTQKMYILKTDRQGKGKIYGINIVYLCLEATLIQQLHLNHAPLLCKPQGKVIKFNSCCPRFEVALNIKLHREVIKFNRSCGF